MARIIDSNEKNLIGSNLKILRKQKKDESTRTFR